MNRKLESLDLNHRERLHMVMVLRAEAGKTISYEEYVLGLERLRGFREGVFACCNVSIMKQELEAQEILKRMAEP